MSDNRSPIVWTVNDLYSVTWEEDGDDKLALFSGHADAIACVKRKSARGIKAHITEPVK